MKAFFFSCLLLLLGIKASAQSGPPPEYIAGGEMFYSYQGMHNGAHVYRATLRCYAKCSNAPFGRSINVSVFDRLTHALVKRFSAPLSNTASENPPGDSGSDCIVNPPSLCTVIAFYSFEVSLPPNANGYVLSAVAPGYRIANLVNFQAGNILATYTAEIPGGTAAVNSSFSIAGDDRVVTCANSSFSYRFGATDFEGDELRYYLCGAYEAGLNADGLLDPLAPPPFQSTLYAPNYSSSMPLGANVKVDEQSGVMTGLAPGKGNYVVCVCIGEYRNGVLIATQRKEIHVEVAPCEITKASLLPEYLLCKENSTLQLSNLSSGFRVERYSWQISSKDGAVLFSDKQPAVAYTFKDTGVYNIKLVINKGVNNCVDSATAIAKVYPGLKPDFIFSGDCASRPTSFTNTSTASLGQINYWKWNFGDDVWGSPAHGISDVTGAFNPSYQYQNGGPKQVQLVVGTNYGCRDTLRRTINITPKPALNTIYKERLICVGDTAQLWAFAPGGGNFSWSPQINMVNGNMDKPLVSPAVTTVYHVLLDKDGCQNRDSVTVRLIDKVHLQAMKDTLVCQGDSIQLKVASDGLAYSWTNVAPQKATLRNPVTTVHTTTDFIVTAFIGGCSAKDTVRVIAVPYPVVHAGADTIICDQTSALLRGRSDGGTITWSPAATLSEPNIPEPIARPKQTTSYVLTAIDTRGCPKPASDTVVVTVLPPIQPFAGRDTTALVGLPLQLQARGGVAYEWSPATALSATNIPNPVAYYNAPDEGIKYKVKVLNEAGCADSAAITVKVVLSRPAIFVPNAFTPNQDGRNDNLRPIAIGMQRIEYFNIYNRWGQLVFSTKMSGQGWDGKVGGQMQSTGVFTWAVKAVDIEGKPYFQKGTVVLIR
jgi:gliding motility-associated-like protein